MPGADDFRGRASASLSSKDVPDWLDLVPRLGMVYDIFGDGKTALKLAVNRYYHYRHGPSKPGQPDQGNERYP